MKTTLLAILVALTSALTTLAQPRIVTIILSEANKTNTVSIADFEYVKVLSARDQLSIPNSYLDITKSGATASWLLRSAYTGLGGDGYPNPEGIVISGPGDITVRGGPSRSFDKPVLVTLEIGPTAFSVTNSVTIGPGQGAEINLESSTDLVKWTAATNGVYTSPDALFFRLHLRRLQ